MAWASVALGEAELEAAWTAGTMVKNADGTMVNKAAAAAHKLAHSYLGANVSTRPSAVVMYDDERSLG